MNKRRTVILRGGLALLIVLLAILFKKIIRPYWYAHFSWGLPLAGFLPSFLYALGGTCILLAFEPYLSHSRRVVVGSFTLGAVLYEILQGAGLFSARTFDPSDIVATLVGAYLGYRWCKPLPANSTLDFPQYQAPGVD
ncbi:MAG: hypothetical protein HC913_01380 [Microscillaceae bacterium]|nr:hypothetical protein [Microscillaceae bacterium]